MVRAMEQEHEGFRSRFFHFRGTHENTGRHAKSLSVESANIFDTVIEDDLSTSRSQGSTPVHNNSSEKHQVAPPLAPSNRSERAPKPKLSSKDDDPAAQTNLLLGELQDVGHAVLESYSRILESLAFTVMSRIEDVLHADGLTQNPSQIATRRKPTSEPPMEKSEELNNNGPETPASMTLLDFMGWGQDQNEAEMKKESFGNSDDLNADSDLKQGNKPGNIVTNKKVSYLENLSAVRSPTARH